MYLFKQYSIIQKDGDDLEIIVSNKANRPLYEQIVSQVKTQIMGGELKAGKGCYVSVQNQDFVLDHVLFTVPGGSVVGLIGENGAGKSTTINAALGMVQKEEGILYQCACGRQPGDTDGGCNAETFYPSAPIKGGVQNIVYALS